jgi:FkbH-like protein
MNKIFFKSNVTIEHYTPSITRHTHSKILFSDYDNTANDMQGMQKINPEYVVFLDFLDNIIEDFEFELLNYDNKLSQATSMYLQKIQLFADAIDRNTTVFFCDLFPFISVQNRTLQVERIMTEVEKINQQIIEILSAKFVNFEKIDTQFLVARLGLSKVINLKFYENNKAPFTEEFLKEICNEILSITRNFSRDYKKVIVLDCDNTLWKGIVGEDGYNGIGIHPYNYPGNIFYKIQKDIKRIKEKGAILAISSKNNLSDVKEVFDKNKNMVLQWDDFSAFAINWEPKPENLSLISKELNLGTDSFVFIDDSNVEIHQMQDRLPGVEAFQVPKRLSNYRADLGQFLYKNFCRSLSGSDKTLEYKTRKLAENLKQETKTFDEFVDALEINLLVSQINSSTFARCHSLINKTNQFNLNGFRMSEAELAEFCNRENAKVYTCTVADKFGESGLTALILLEIENELISVKHMVVSCRILGRGIEEVLLDYVLSLLPKSEQLHNIKFCYLKTAKNQIVNDFLLKILSRDNDLTKVISKKNLKLNKRKMEISYE